MFLCKDCGGSNITQWTDAYQGTGKCKGVSPYVKAAGKASAC
jgi:hypothetical protein